jgi:kynurenine formamidase
LDIVLLQTGCDRKVDSAEYFEQPGMGRESTLWLVEQGIRVIGIDAFGGASAGFARVVAFVDDGEQR